MERWNNYCTRIKERNIMENKERVIKLLQNNFKPTGYYPTCKLCKLYIIQKIYPGRHNCEGCILADSNGYQGCWDSNAEYHAEFLTKKKSLLVVRKYIKLAVPILKKLPDERFIKEGWVYFKEIESLKHEMFAELNLLYVKMDDELENLLCLTK